MSRKNLSVRRQNQLAALPDVDLPLINLNDLNSGTTVFQPTTSANHHIPNQTQDQLNLVDGNSSTNQETNSSIESDRESMNSKFSESEESVEDQREKLRENLRNIAIQDNMNITTLTKLLHALHPFHPDLPLDGRTLLRTPVQHCVREMGIGQYAHIGIESGLAAIPNLTLDTNTINLLFNIDGLPLTRGNQQNLWPILCQVRNKECEVFPVGIYQGSKKPDSFNCFMAEFVEELNMLVKKGVYINNKKINIVIDGFIMDAPASANMMHVSPYNAYNGCRKCETEGKYNGKVVFPELNSPLRSDKSFREKSCPEHHKGTTLLETLPIDMVACFPNDPMHLVHLGVMKKIIRLLIDRKKVGNQTLKPPTISQINEKIAKCNKYFPREFQRKPRDINHFKTWKATEFRYFLLYTGPFVLKGCVPMSTYKNFMMLSTAIRILSSHQYLQYNSQANELLRCFVQSFEKLYGSQHVTYNVHCLIHLAADSKRFGPLEKFSAYPFESFLGKLKITSRSSYKPLQQILNRISERRTIQSTNSCMQYDEVKFSKRVKDTNQFLRATFKTYTITSNSYGEDCVFLKTQIAIRIISFDGDRQFYGQEITNVKEFYNETTSLKELHNIFVGSFSNEIKTFSIKDIAMKLVYFPINDDTYYFTPLIHTAS